MITQRLHARKSALMLAHVNQVLHYWRRHPSHAAWIVGVLVVASAVTTAVWSVADGLWLRPLPFTNPEQLVTVGWTTTIVLLL